MLSKILSSITKGMMLSGYARAAKELRALSDRQLADIGVSRELLVKGASAYPWREEEQVVSQAIPANLSTIDTSSIYNDVSVRPQTPKAA